ncbi:MAG: hypothetical protein CMM10_17860 [Rhodospirillaceae bacterium]|nr:hypothetical protein [Rhodospirillaceae bacterium]
MDAYLQSWFVQKQNGDTIFYPGYGRKGYLIEDEITYKKFCKLMKMKHLFGAIFSLIIIIFTCYFIFSSRIIYPPDFLGNLFSYLIMLFLIELVVILAIKIYIKFLLRSLKRITERYTFRMRLRKYYSKLEFRPLWLFSICIAVLSAAFVWPLPIILEIDTYWAVLIVFLPVLMLFIQPATKYYFCRSTGRGQKANQRS